MNRKELLLIVNNLIDHVGEEKFFEVAIGDKKDFSKYLQTAEIWLIIRVKKQKGVI